jgi:muramoyltetrapeptide carboxypeptidase
MKRSTFISGTTLAAGAFLLPDMQAAAGEDHNAVPHMPPYLKAGDTIAITSPAGYIKTDEIAPAVARLQEWGLRVRVGGTVGRRDCSFGGSDAERAMDMQVLMDDPAVKAILCARGGYGITRILDSLDLTRFRDRPKWLIGFSDITALHLHLTHSHPIASLHAKMCNSFPVEWDKAEPVVQETILSIRDALTGKKMAYAVPPDPANRFGKGAGMLVGGNLSVIQTCMGTRSEIQTRDRILFLEEVGEYPYSLDRMLTNLQRAGKLEGLHGLLIGGFNRIKPDDPGEEFGRTVSEMVMEKVAGKPYPVCFNFPVGHQKNNFALKCGAVHTLVVDEQGAKLTER